MAEKSAKPSSTAVEVNIVSARDLKNTKMFGKMAPCALVTIVNASMSQVTSPAVNGGASPTWNQVLVFQVPESALQSANPKPSVKIELFDSSELKKSLGEVHIPLAQAVANYDQEQRSTLGVFRKGKSHGYLSFSIKCAKPSFAPAKGGSEYDSYVKKLVPTPPPQATRANPAPAAAAAAYSAQRPAYPQQQPTYAGAYPQHQPAPGYPQRPPAYGAPPPGYPPQYQAPPYGYPPQYQAHAYPPPGYPHYPPPYGAPPPNVVVVQGGGYNNGYGGGMGGMGGLGVGLVAGAAGGLLLGAALDNDFGGCGGGGCGGGGCG